MKTIFDQTTKQRVPIHVWTDPKTIEPAALKQLNATASLPFVYKHVAIMPDVHHGVGATVGSVVATKDAICPACVGVDIGCGMMAIQTDLHYPTVQDNVAAIRQAIEAVVPVGFAENQELYGLGDNWVGWSRFLGMESCTPNLFKKARAQMGSLGGGNHFIELCTDLEGKVWIMLHSGSRGTGNLLARKHIDSAKGLMKKFFVELPDPDLAFLPQHTKEFDHYIQDLKFAQDYAMQNRVEMMYRVVRAIRATLKMGQDIGVTNEVNCHHNYVAWENHFGENVMVTRKGAVRARAGDMGIIPGSMGAKSFIVRGLGNRMSFDSCSHGAGRKMSRTKARERFTLAELKEQTVGVECRKDDGVLDEIPGAYKDIDQVMADQADLVEIVAQLKQFMCIKG